MDQYLDMTDSYYITGIYFQGIESLLTMMTAIIIREEEEAGVSLKYNPRHLQFMDEYINMCERFIPGWDIVYVHRIVYVHF